MAITIDKGVPIPEPRGGTGVVAALRAMQVGDSFVIPVSKRPSIYNQARIAGISVAVRSQGDGTVRVWRKAA